MILSVKIRFLGVLKDFQPCENAAGIWEANLAGKTIDELLTSTGMAEQGWDYVALINGDTARQGYVLKDDDRLDVMTTIAGG